MTTPFDAARWQQFWANFRGEPQQIAGIEELRLAIEQAKPELLTEDASWVANFHKEQPKPQVITGIPYFNQLLMDDGQGWRDCFSASAAMLCAWAGKVQTENEYNHVRQKYGDSTDAGAQTAAIAAIGLKAHYGTNGSRPQLELLLDQGIPVACGILHHGQASAPSGGGHWMVAVGHDNDGVICLDPYGELNVANGTWAQQGSGGDHVHYSWRNWLPRWEVAGGDGYLLWVSR